MNAKLTAWITGNRKWAMTIVVIVIMTFMCVLEKMTGGTYTDALIWIVGAFASGKVIEQGSTVKKDDELPKDIQTLLITIVCVALLTSLAYLNKLGTGETNGREYADAMMWIVGIFMGANASEHVVGAFRKPGISGQTSTQPPTATAQEL